MSDQSAAVHTAPILDAVTFEVIRHRLWAINDDQARMAARLSGSFIVFEGYDFNAALTTADGRGLYTGVYILHHGATIDEFVRRVLEQWPLDDIRPGDMFFTNDPWDGALHANDGILVMPLFADGELVGWSGIVTHDQDVGSPAPGSFVVGAQDRFGEAPLFPAVRMARDFELLADVERAYLRNSRTPEQNALNMRARLAALRMAYRRIDELIGEYGREAFEAAQEGILAYVERVLRSRLGSLPDGSWQAKGYLDHDGNTDAIYPICCRAIKHGERLIFDWTGTSPQAVGAINCAAPAMMGATLGVVMASLCYDLPWAIGALRNVVEFVSEPGTINNAVSPAAVSMASVMGALTTMDVASTAFAKLLQASEIYAAEAQATWSPGVHGGLFLGLSERGAPAVSALCDPFGGGGGARTDRDGIDSGGIPHSMASRVANVEVLESRAPMLQLYRRQKQDSGGPGRLRGGVSLESGGIAHKGGGPSLYQTLASGVAVPGGRGLSGGRPGAAASGRVLRATNVEQLFADGRMPTSPQELTADAIDVQPAKAFTMLEPGDVVIAVEPGGAGVGDPLRRAPRAVARDVAAGLVSAEQAQQAYGVILADAAVDVERTDAERAARRHTRLHDGARGADAAHGPIEGGEVLHPVGDAVQAVEVGGRRLLRCTVCSERLAAYEEDFKPACVLRELSLADGMPANSECDPGYALREYCCPGCGTALAVDVQKRSEPVMAELSLGSAPSGSAVS
jgi:N-methylhydantoinase B